MALAPSGTAQSAFSTTAVASFSVNAPTGIQDGDLWMVAVDHSPSSGTNPRTLTPSVGWFRLGSQVTITGGYALDIFYRTWRLGEATSVSFNLSANVAAYGAVSVGFSGADTSSPFATPASSGNTSGSTTSHTLPSITTTRDNAFAIAIACINTSSTTFTAYPAGYTDDKEVAGKRIDLRHASVASSGTAQSGFTFTSSAGAQDIMLQVELKPLPVGLLSAPASAVVDSFNRADETTLTGGWSTPTVVGQSSCRVVTNQCKAPAVGTGSNYRSTQFAADQEGFFDIPVIGTAPELHLRIQNPNSGSLNEIYLYFQSNQLRAGQYVSGTATDFAAQPPAITWVNNDSLWAYVRGSTLYAFRKVSGGNWILIYTQAVTVSGVGYAGISITGATPVIDNFGAGSLSQQVALGLITESDTPLAIARRKTITLGIVSEADSTFAVTGKKVKLIALGLNAETDSVFALLARKTRVLNQASETDSPLAITQRKARVLAQAAETDSLFALLARKTKTLNQASETDSTFALAKRKSRTLAQTLETDSALAIVGKKIRLIALGLTSESEQALALSARKTKTLAQALESDSTFALTKRKLRALNQALESDSTFALLKRKSRTLAQTLETDSALAITRAIPNQIIVALGLTSEVDSLFALLKRKSRTIAQTSDTESTFALSRRKVIRLGIASESDSALTLTKRKLLALATESDSTFALARRKSRTLAQAQESDSLFTINGLKIFTLGIAEEFDETFKVRAFGVVRAPLKHVRASSRAHVVSGAAARERIISSAHVEDSGQTAVRQPRVHAYTTQREIDVNGH